MKGIFFCTLLVILGFNTSAQSINKQKVKKLLKNSEVMSTHYVGFALYDLKNRKMIFEQNSDKYFTPASNTKLFTFYAGLKMLKDSVPGLQYIEKSDSLIFWGTGDPSLLHPDFPSQPVIQKLNSFKKDLFFSHGRYKGNFYGLGWSYDDYNDYYQPEISELPLYGNIIRFVNSNGVLQSVPLADITKNVFTFVSDSSIKKYAVKRGLFNNSFNVPILPLPSKYTQEVPYKTSLPLTESFLEENLPNFKRSVHAKLPVGYKTIYSQPKDTLFRHLLLPSDNFIAEQLLLTYAAENNLEMNTDTVIDYVEKNYLQDLPDKPIWVDGSGLSRHNLFTPRDMVRICEKIYDEVNNEDRLFDLLPQGGRTGTIRNLFKGEDKPFVVAKTGTLSNNHNLTGYLITKKGRRLIFSFMNNNYTEPTSAIRLEMERILTLIYKNN